MLWLRVVKAVTWAHNQQRNNTDDQTIKQDVGTLNLQTNKQQPTG